MCPSLKAALRSFFPPTKFVPRSHLSSRTLPLCLMKSLSALHLINSSVSIKFKIFKCIPRKQKLVKIKSQCLSSFRSSFMSHSALSELVGNRGAPIYNSITRLSMDVLLHTTVWDSSWVQQRGVLFHLQRRLRGVDLYSEQPLSSRNRSVLEMGMVCFSFLFLLSLLGLF